MASLRQIRSHDTARSPIRVTSVPGRTRGFHLERKAALSSGAIRFERASFTRLLRNKRRVCSPSSSLSRSLFSPEARPHTAFDPNGKCATGDGGGGPFPVRSHRANVFLCEASAAFSPVFLLRNRLCYVNAEVNETVSNFFVLFSPHAPVGLLRHSVSFPSDAHDETGVNVVLEREPSAPRAQRGSGHRTTQDLCGRRVETPGDHRS